MTHLNIVKLFSKKTRILKCAGFLKTNYLTINLRKYQPY